MKVNFRPVSCDVINTVYYTRIIRKESHFYEEKVRFDLIWSYEQLHLQHNVIDNARVVKST